MVSAITQTPASGPLALVTTPAMSSGSVGMVWPRQVKAREMRTAVAFMRVLLGGKYIPYLKRRLFHAGTKVEASVQIAQEIGAAPEGPRKTDRAAGRLGVSARVRNRY